MCKVAGCLSAAKSVGYCKIHYARVYRHGTPYLLRPKRYVGEVTIRGKQKYVYLPNHPLSTKERSFRGWVRESLLLASKLHPGVTNRTAFRLNLLSANKLMFQSLGHRTLVCPQCGKQFVRRISRIIVHHKRRGQTPILCSRSCRATFSNHFRSRSHSRKVKTMPVPTKPNSVPTDKRSWRVVLDELYKALEGHGLKAWTVACGVRMLYYSQEFLSEQHNNKPDDRDAELRKFTSMYGMTLLDFLNMVNYFPLEADWEDGDLNRLRESTCQAMLAEERSLKKINGDAPIRRTATVYQVASLKKLCKELAGGKKQAEGQVSRLKARIKELEQEVKKLKEENQRLKQQAKQRRRPVTA